MPRGISLNAAIMLILVLVSASMAQGRTWDVPRDHATIQAAIAAATNGDTIMVGPGLYYENIDFLGKSISVRSRHGTALTVIDGSGSGSVVTFSGGEDAGTVLDGFTLINGAGTEDGGTGVYRGGAVLCVGADPTITGNILRGNTATVGGAIYCSGSSPLIAENVITANNADEGAGIACVDSSSPIIAGNMIHDNTAAGAGGGILCRNDSSPVMGHNTLTRNHAAEGGGIHIASLCTPVAVNSIIWGNTAASGPEAWIGTELEPSTLVISYSNVAGGQNDIFIELNCLLDWGDGMIDADPLFVDSLNGDFHLPSDSPCTDAGDNLGAAMRPTDFEGDPRIHDGTTDMGADESFSGEVLLVPADYDSIEAAIEAADNGDEIIVDPGTYNERIDFLGKAVVVRSRDGAAATVIDGGFKGSVVTFKSGEGPSSVLEGFTITNGDAGNGAGIYCNGSSPVIRNNVICANFSWYGAGIYGSGASPMIEGNIVFDNEAWGGGALYFREGSSPVIASNLIHDNRGDVDGGGIMCSESSVLVTGNTLVRNSAFGRGGGLHCTKKSVVRVVNSIFWDNSAYQGDEISVGGFWDGAVLEISYSDVKGGQQSVNVSSGSTLDWGAGMIDVDPLFVDEAANNFRIKPDSGCRDAGDDNAPGLSGRDFEGQPRVAFAAVDIGGDEYFMPGNVILVVIDGLRGLEGFDDLSHQYIPHLWNDLRPLGTMYTNFVNQGYTVTTPGHAAMTSGVTQYIPNNILNYYGAVKRIQEEPSIFQYYRRQLGVPKDKTWIVNGKGGMIFWTGVCQNPYYGKNYVPHVAFNEPVRDDDTWIETQRVMDTYRPSLMMVNFKDVDDKGHAGDWEDYIDAIENADRLVYELYQKVQSDPYYKDNTAILITSDHGRHLDGIYSGFVDHGCSCQGCRRVPFLAIGPNIRKNTVIDVEGHLRDIAHTIGAILGFEVEHGHGQILRDIFEVPPPPTGVARTHSTVACEGVRTHTAFCSSFEGHCRIVYANSTGKGKGWGNLRILSPRPYNSMPSIASEGDKVAVAWSSIHEDGSCRVSLRESLDGGASWSKIWNFTGAAVRQYDLFPSVCYRQGTLYLAWSEMKYGNSALHMVRIRKSQVIGMELFSDYLVMRPRCAASDAGIHVVYQTFDPENRNWDLAYCLHDGTDWQTPVRIIETSGESLRPDIACDQNGLHVVWGENVQGRFTVTYMNSADGSVWSDSKILGGSAYGDWRPRIAVGADKLLVVWEDYEGRKPAVVGRNSTDGGNTWSQNFVITKNDPGCIYPALSIDSQDRMSLFWIKMTWPNQLGFLRSDI